MSNDATGQFWDRTPDQQREATINEQRKQIDMARRAFDKHLQDAFNERREVAAHLAKLRFLQALPEGALLADYTSAIEAAAHAAVEQMVAKYRAGDPTWLVS